MSIRKIAGAVGLVFAAVVGYLCLWPIPADPKPWSAPTAPGYVGAHKTNARLAQLRTIAIEDELGPENIALGPDGRLYVAMSSGRVLRMDPDGGHRQVFADTGGRVLGFDFDSKGRLIAADAMKGLLSIEPDGSSKLLTDRVSAGDPVRYANSVAIGADDSIYFTDSSGRFSPAEWGGTLRASVLDILEQAATGRVLVYDPLAHTTRVVARGFSFANGIALSVDGASLIVAETGRYRLWKVDAHARDVDVQQDSPQARVLKDNLPGYPDNVTRGIEGRLWVGLFQPRNPAADSLAQHPALRKILLRLPPSMLPTGKPYGHVFAIDEDGRVLEDLQDSHGAYPGTTGATEVAGRLYIHSLHAPVIGWLPRPSPVEELYLLRSIRERRPQGADACQTSETGFEPFAEDAERNFSFWSVETAANGRITDAQRASVAELRGCFGPTSDRARQNFYADVHLDQLRFKGRGECLALALNVPEPGLFPVRCQLVLEGLPPPYVGGLLTTNTMTSEMAFGGATRPAGYIQASLATIRLWKQRPSSGDLR